MLPPPGCATVGRIRLGASGREGPRQAQRRPDRIRRDDLRRRGRMDERGVALSGCRQAVGAGDQVVAGTPEVRYDEVAEVLVASPFPPGEDPGSSGVGVRALP